MSRPFSFPKNKDNKDRSIDSRPKEERGLFFSSWLTKVRRGGYITTIKGITQEQACRSSIKGTDIMDDFRFKETRTRSAPNKIVCIFFRRSVCKSTRRLRHDHFSLQLHDRESVECQREQETSTRTYVFQYDGDEYQVEQMLCSSLLDENNCTKRLVLLLASS